MAAELQSHFQYWKSFDLPALQKELDQTANDIAVRQDASGSSRTRLVELSKEFKSNSHEETRKQVAPLLKSFQTEVDALSRRSKAAEGAFLSIYKRLIDVPNPVLVLEQSITYQKTASKVSDYEIENVKLRETLAEYNSEFAEVKNQEVTIKTLKDKLKEYELKITSEVQLRVQEKEKELNRTHQEKEKLVHEAQISFARRLGEAEQQINFLKSALENSQSELFDAKSKMEEASTAKADEAEMLIADLERANERANLAEKHMETLKLKIEELQAYNSDVKGRDLDQAIDQMKKSNLELELSAKEKQLSQLVEEVQKLQAALSKQTQEFSHRTASLEEELSARNTRINQLTESLNAQADYAEMKKELLILKSIEFPATQEDSTDKIKPLETLLIEKNRALQNEQMRLKNSNAELTESAERVKIETQIDPVSNSPPLASNDMHQRSRPASESPEDPRISSSNRSSPALIWNPPLYMNQLDFNKECLDTLDVSNRVKEVLSVHNIGQRLFAKHVLGLSQGTVSELLSKPKHWEKLTEKGRESYRKMFFWVRDMRNIDALKNMSPRKPPGPVVMSKQESSSAEERITQILKEAQDAMTNRQTVDQSHYLSQHAHPKSRSHPNANPHSRSRSKEENNGNGFMDASSEAIVSRIYEEELSKLAEQSRIAGNLSEYQLYQAEIQRLIVKKGSMSPKSSNGSSLQHHPSQDEPEDLSFTERKPRSRSIEHRFDRISDRGRRRTSQSPLQQMQNITNQFFSSTQAHLLQQKPLKHVLPPISQEQCERFTSLNTEELVRKVKELLSQFSISQRLFGENVLGLSQGSVSDLLARPKPWSMLTQKGREPFIRMKIFSEDPEAVRSLMSNQYKMNNQPETRSSFRESSSSFTKEPERCRSDDTVDSWIPTMVPNPMNGLVQAPSIIELVAATGELDTLSVTSRVKEMLQFHNIGQKLFGEAVLGLSQGSVSDMLSKPKPWTLLSLKGREPFVRMHLWLSDPMNIVRLKSYQAEIKAFRRRSGSLGNQNDETNDRASPYTFSKKPRYSFTEDQKNKLRIAFQDDPYPTSASIESLALKMDLNPKTVINWFHNHRMRSKQQNRDENGRRLNGVYIKQEAADTTSRDSSCQNSFNGSFPSMAGSPEMDPPSPIDRVPVLPMNMNSYPPATCGGRKRKSAHPQYVSAGAVLDKHNTTEDQDDEIDVGGPSDITIQSPVVNESSIDQSKQVSDEPHEKIARIEKSIQSPDQEWEDGVNRDDCVRRIETSINNSETPEDWEF